MTKKQAIMLNGTLALGSDAERESLMGFIGRIRDLRVKRDGWQFALLEECAKFDESGVWQLYGTWTFARVLREECGVKVADYEVYKAALAYVSAEDAREMGMTALREIRRALRSVSDDKRPDIAATLTTIVQRRLEAFHVEHGFAPTSKGASAIVRTQAESLGIDVKGAKADGLQQRYRWLVNTLEQIESLSDDGSAIGALARNALGRVSGRTAKKQGMTRREQTSA